MTTLYDKVLAANQAVRDAVGKAGLVEGPEMTREQAIEIAIKAMERTTPVSKADIEDANMRHVRGTIKALMDLGLRELDAKRIERLAAEEERLTCEWHDAVRDAKSEQELEALGGLREMQLEEAYELNGNLAFCIIDGRCVSSEYMQEEDGFVVMQATYFVEKRGRLSMVNGELDLPPNVKLYTFTSDREPVSFGRLRVA